MKINRRSLSVFAILLFSAAILCLVWLCRPGYAVPILTYHSIGYEDDLVTVTPENFARPAAYLKDGACEVTSLKELCDRIKRNEDLGHKAVVIAFADGRKDS